MISLFFKYINMKTEDLNNMIVSLLIIKIVRSFII